MNELLNYTLPENLIAKYPTPERSNAKMLRLYRNNSSIVNNHIGDLINYLEPGDCLVINNTKVIPAQLNGYKTTKGQVHCQIDKIINTYEAIVFLKANRAPKIEEKIYFSEAIYLVIKEKNNSRYKAAFNTPIDNVLKELGSPPIPPYLKRAAEPIDKIRYQTCFAETPGAVAAPTAGLHFDEELLLKLKAKGISIAKITLHVGAGTFETLKPEQLKTGKLHSETIIVDQNFCDIYNKTKKNNKKVIAVGTTSVRTLETIAQPNQALLPFTGETDLLIQPGYKFKAIDGLLTNFHLPKSSLLLLISAFYGIEKTLAAYQYAIENDYRFFSYGDCMLLI